jgi:hypothetical protein
MPAVRLKKLFIAAAFVGNDNANLPPTLPSRPSLDHIATDLHCRECSFSSLAQERDSLFKNAKILLAVDQPFGGEELCARFPPRQHSAIASEVLWRDFECGFDVVNGGGAFTHPEERFCPQHKAMRIGKRPDSAPPVG